jgi:diguanylate cyclase (GGDEF)-like protein
LQEQAQKDSLTQIYNAQTARKLAEQYLAEVPENSKCALMIVDLDDFKQVNDTYGHMLGDTVLVQTAKTIQKMFRSKDIIGRIGGDEFTVFMKDVPNKEIVNIRCEQLNKSLHNVLSSQMVNDPLSCSIGVAFAPDQGTTYYELFERADQALYRAKDQGKDTYICSE